MNTGDKILLEDSLNRILLLINDHIQSDIPIGPEDKLDLIHLIKSTTQAVKKIVPNS